PEWPSTTARPVSLPVTNRTPRTVRSFLSVSCCSRVSSSTVIAPRMAITGAEGAGCEVSPAVATRTGTSNKVRKTKTQSSSRIGFMASSPLKQKLPLAMAYNKGVTPSRDRRCAWLDASSNDHALLLGRNCLLLLLCVAAGTHSTGKLTLCLTRSEKDGQTSS